MEIYNDTITIINILDKVDSDTDEKEVHKTIVTGCGWYSESISEITGAQINTGQKVKVLIPFDKGYSEYDEWKEEQEGFTLRPNDYVFKGSISDTVTVSNIQQICNSYKPNAIKVKYVEVLEKRTGVPIKIQLRIEG